MYELSRVRLHSVGPKGARYQDVALDLRHVGPPVPAPVQRALFATGPAGVLRRPSPASVLFAENGNGKSVLIKLIFSVMLPGRRQIVGTTSTRALDDFVLADDVAHVILEWQHTRTGQRVITGKTSAWRGHVVSSDPNKLLEGWWSLRPTDQLDLDNLPLTQQGRQVELSGFKDRLTEAHRQEPHLQFEWLTSPGAWTEHLGTLDLDSKLFGYQRRMNAGEGEAADAFSFKSDEAFVDWLLRAVTDEEEPRLLAELIDGYAGQLADRASMVAERDFVDGALGLLGPLAAAAKEADAAAEVSADVAREAAQFIGAIKARWAEETGRFGVLGVRRDTAAEQAEVTAQQNRRMNRIVLELRRDRARIEWQLAEASLKELTDRLTAQQADLAAWKATDTLLAFQRAQGAAKAIGDLVAAKEAEAAGPMRARDAAARRLVQGLLALIDRAEAEVERLTARARVLDQEIAELAEEENAQREAIGQEKGRAQAAREKISSARDEVARAVASGLLGEGRAPTEAAEEAEATAGEAETAVSAAETEHGRLGDQRRLLDSAARAAERKAEGRRADLAGKTRVLEAAVTATTALAAEERLAAVLGVASITLEDDHPSLLTRLGEIIAENGEELVARQLADAADRRVLDALQTGELFPPRSEITTALQALDEAGIRAYAGWDYLAKVPEDRREHLMAAHPQLVDGVVLNNPQHLDRAEEVLAAARLLPRSIVVVGTTETLGGTARAEASGTEYVVPPNPAMYDVDLAAAERQRLLETTRERRTQIDTLTAQIQHDQALVRRLQDWERSWPPGTIEQLTTERDVAQDELEKAENQAADLLARIARINKAEEAITTSLPDLRAVAKKARNRSSELAALAQLTAQEPAWSHALKEAQEAAAAAQLAADDARNRAEARREDKSELHREIDDQKRTIATTREEIGRIPGGGSADRTATPPNDSVETLRATYQAAKEAYEQVEVGADLRAELAAKLNAEAQARAGLEKVPEIVRVRATELLSGPDGADAASRSAATARTERAVESLTSQAGAARGQAGRRQEAYEAFQAQEVSMEPYGHPRDLAHADELLGVASSDYERARQADDEAQRHLGDLDKTIEATKKTAADFESLYDSVSALTAASDDEPPFTGDVTAARDRRARIRTSVSEAEDMLANAQGEVRRLSSSLGQYAVGQAFEKVDSPVRQQMIAVDRDRLAEHAADWEHALKPRLRSLTDDLAHIDRHRTEIVVRLRGMVEIALKTLRTAEKVSALPEALGDWAGLRFLHIRFTELEPPVLDARLGEVVDEAATGTAKTTGGKRDGLSLLLKGVRAAMPKGVRVDILKPDAALRAERVRVSSVAEIFSGGQLLTAAIILYCTMAALRSNERGQLRRPHAGVLFLDNPIGRASAGYLLDLQLGVADALGVQLIYTTGLFDINALSLFPLIVRLRNDRDLRSGMAYLTVEDEIRSGLPTDGDPEHGQITAARFFRRPANIEEAG
ncbi:hypothetical protein SAMN04489727_2071 [Amycolatopsis tolypomycina]|uniref:Chromosome segregation ATPase n=1 Tax=Amycolatopsis tolypomycina TaxID=208445 RepID=A0A1H4JNN2_9PSEU|nr:hypothetical protein [Amycolatopsis tolypomycina]SEB47921.1 hypothetical protein SAMN04489727_2071 [Amycolatopsis tolypomycina]